MSKDEDAKVAHITASSSHHHRRLLLVINISRLHRRHFFCSPPPTHHLLKATTGTFARAAKDMPRISMETTGHELNVDPTFKPIKHKQRRLGPERADAVNSEVNRLLKVGSIVESKFLSLSVFNRLGRILLSAQGQIVQMRPSLAVITTARETISKGQNETIEEELHVDDQEPCFDDAYYNLHTELELPDRPDDLAPSTSRPDDLTTSTSSTSRPDDLTTSTSSTSQPDDLKTSISSTTSTRRPDT